MAKGRKSKNSVRTTKRVATIASKVLRDGRFGKDAKAVAASTLRNRAP